MQGSMTEGAGDMSLAKANGTNEDDVGVVCDEGQTEQVLDLRAIDLFWPAPLKVFHRLEDGEAGLSDAPLDSAALAPGSFALDQLGEIRKVRDLLLSGCGGQVLVVALYVGEVQGIELRIQALKITWGHGSSRRQ
jgi:hypothetical protein